MKCLVRLFVLLFILFCNLTVSQTVVQGNVSGQWTKAGSPYKIIIGDVTVPAGETLTIDPGVVVQLDLGLNFKIDGTLNAIGTVADSIRFTTAQALPAIGQWGAIIISGTAMVAYAVVEYGNGSANNLEGTIAAVNGSAILQIRNSFIRLNIHGVEVLGTNSKILNSRIENCTTWALHLGLGAVADSMSILNNAEGISDVPSVGGDILITNSTVQGSNSGLQADDGGKFVIKKCAFIKNKYGICLTENSSSTSSINVDSSTISQNTDYGVFISDGGDYQVINHSIISQNGTGVRYHAFNKCEIISSIVKDNVLEGILNSGGSSDNNVTIRYCEVKSNGGDAGASAVTGRFSAIGCVFANNSGHGVNAYNIIMDSCVIIGNGKIGVYSSVSYPISIRRTVIAKNGQAGLSNIGSNSIIENNTIVNNAGGIENINSNTGVVIRNNIISNNSGNGLNLKVSPAPSVRFNLVNSNTVNWNGFATSYGNDSLGFLNQRGVACDPFSNIDINPQFVKPDSNNFALLFNSPAISAGDTLSPKNSDSSYADIGAIAYKRQVFAPINLTASIYCAVVNLSWQNGGGTEPRNYYIYRGSNPIEMSIVDSSNSTTYQDSVLYLSPNIYYFITAIDSLFNESYASATAHVQNGTPVSGNAVQLNASWIDVGGKAAVDASQIFTLEAWIYQTSIVPQGHGSRIIDNNREGESDSWTFDVIGGNNVLRFISGPYCLSPGCNSATGQTTVTLNEWHHVAVVVGASTTQLYLDGKLDGQGTRSGPWNGNTLDIRIGSYIASGLGTMDEYFYGSMDEVRMWNKALSQREIQSRMYRPLTGYEPNLAAYFTMDQTGSGAFVNVINNSLNANRTNDGVTHSNGTLEFVTSTAPISQISTLALNTTPIDFGPVKLHSTKNVNLLTQAELGSVKIKSIGFLHDTFSVTPTSGGLKPGDSLTLILSFNPQQYGSYADTLIIQSNANTGNYAIPVSGTSPQPTLFSSVSNHIFYANNLVDTVTKLVVLSQQTVNVVNIDTVFTLFQNFKLLLQTKQVVDSSTLTITFIPTKYGWLHDTLFVFSNATNSVVKIPLEANVPYPTVLFGAALNFGNVAVGDSLTQTILLGSPNPNGTEFDDIHTNSNLFAVSPLSATITAKDTLKLSVKFTPALFGLSSDTLFVGSSSNGSVTLIVLKGNSPYPTIVPLQNSLQFDKVLVNTVQQKRISIINTSINYLSLYAIHVSLPQFKVEGRSFEGFVKRGDTLGITISFQASTAGNFIDTLRLICDAETDTLYIPLSGNSTLTNIMRESDVIPKEFSLSQNFPNPFNPSTTIKFGLPEAGNVTLKIYDVLGREVATLVNDQLSAGYYNYSWNAGNLSSGMYLYRITATSVKGEKKQVFNQVKKLLLMK